VSKLEFSINGITFSLAITHNRHSEVEGKLCLDIQTIQLSHGREVSSGYSGLKTDVPGSGLRPDLSRSIDIQPCRLQAETLEINPMLSRLGAHVELIGRMG